MVHMVVNLPALFAILVYKLDHCRFYTELCAIKESHPDFSISMLYKINKYQSILAMYKLVYLFEFDSLRPINNLSVM